MDPISRTGLAALLPDDVEVEERTSDVPLTTLLPQEFAAIARAVPVRQAEFATARHCARQALSRLGYPAAPILAGKSREPLWPDGVVGSLTHCDGYRAAAVTNSPRIASVGIDAEVHQPLPEGVDKGVTVAGEMQMLNRLAALHPAIHWGRVLFSAKESIYKTWYPLTQGLAGLHRLRTRHRPRPRDLHRTPAGARTTRLRYCDRPLRRPMVSRRPPRADSGLGQPRFSTASRPTVTPVSVGTARSEVSTPGIRDSRVTES
ncbi:4'-phosphopantetheinyl transferase superfamily protein [Kribbella sp. NPDC056861]|uniref:4'-phosphopantetheinyl transferase family protein n=1 Tax=Kribbella sp. NPDC056861 TaxID=3154857 RepID=UPI003422D325